MKHSRAEIVREYGPFPDVANVGGVTWDGERVWFAAGSALTAFDPETGETTLSHALTAPAGTAWDGTHLWQIADGQIHRIDPGTGRVLSSIAAPPGASDAGLAWAEGTLWIGQHFGRKVMQIDPETGEVLRTLASDRHVTGITWVDGDLWHGTWEGGASDIRRIDRETAEVLERIEMPEGTGVSGLEWDGGEQFFCGGGPSGIVRSVKRSTCQP